MTNKLEFLIGFGLLAIAFICLSLLLYNLGKPSVVLIITLFSGLVFAVLTFITFVLFLVSPEIKAMSIKEERFSMFIGLGIISIICLVLSIYLFTIGYPPDIFLLYLVFAGIVFAILTIIALFYYLVAINIVKTYAWEGKELIIFGVAITVLVIAGVLRLTDKISQDVWLNITLLIVTNLITGKVVYEYARRENR